MIHRSVEPFPSEQKKPGKWEHTPIAEIFATTTTRAVEKDKLVRVRFRTLVPFPEQCFQLLEISPNGTKQTHRGVLFAQKRFQNSRTREITIIF